MEKLNFIDIEILANELIKKMVEREDSEYKVKFEQLQEETMLKEAKQELGWSVEHYFNSESTVNFIVSNSSVKNFMFKHDMKPSEVLELCKKVYDLYYKVEEGEEDGN